MIEAQANDVLRRLLMENMQATLTTVQRKCRECVEANDGSYAMLSAPEAHLLLKHLEAHSEALTVLRPDTRGPLPGA